MRNWRVPIRITLTRRCPEGFYLVVNGSRLWFKRRSAAIAAIDSVLALQRIQVVSLREFAARKKIRAKFQLPT